MFGLYWGIALNLILLFHDWNLPVSSRIYKDHFALVLIVISLMLFGIKKVRKDILYPFLGIIIFVFLTKKSLVGVTKIAMIQNTEWIYFMIWILFMFQCLTIGKDDRKHLSRWIFIAGLVSSGYTFLNWAGIYPIRWFGMHVPPIPASEAISGVLQNRMTSAGLTALTIPFFMTRERWPYVVLPLVSIYLMDSATATIPLLMFFGLLLFDKCTIIRKYWKSLSLVSVAFFAFSWGYYDKFQKFLQLSGRQHVWSDLITKEFTNFIGKGINHFRRTYGKNYFDGVRYDHPHNEYMTIVMAFGWVGLLYFIYLATRISPKNRAFFYCFLIGLINALGAFPFHLSATAAIILLSYGACLKGDDDEINCFTMSNRFNRFRS